MEEEEKEKRVVLSYSSSFREFSSVETAVESPKKISAAAAQPQVAVNDEEEEEEEFSFVLRDPESGPGITADEIFFDGRIRPVYPVFNRDLLLLLPDCGGGGGGGGSGGDNSTATAPEEEKKAVRLSLRRLLIEEREAEPSRSSSLSSSSSSSGLDELEGIPPDSYCVWTPRGAAQSPAQCPKSSSTGSSMRWRLRNLVSGRSHSDGKEKFVFLAAEEKKDKANSSNSRAAAAPVKKDKNGKNIKSNNNSGSGRRTKEMDVVAAHRVYYGKRGDRTAAKGSRRSFLPYKPDLIGFFANVNVLSRTHHPF